MRSGQGNRGGCRAPIVGYVQEMQRDMVTAPLERVMYTLSYQGPEAFCLCRLISAAHLL